MQTALVRRRIEEKGGFGFVMQKAFTMAQEAVERQQRGGSRSDVFQKRFF
jgi:hypothetical protein